MAVDARRRHQGREAVEQLQRSEDLRATAAGAGFAGVVDQVLGIALLQPVQGERRAGAVTQQSLPTRLVGSLDAQ